MPAAIVLIAAVCFAPVLQNDFVNWDDRVNLLENRHQSCAKPWFDKLTTLSTIEGQRRKGDGPRFVIPSECEGSEKDFSRWSK
jgi:hypothetical protein